MSRQTIHLRVLLLASMAFLAVCSCMGQGGTLPQSSFSADAPYVPTMTFDVTSVRESKPDPRGFTVGGSFADKAGSLNMTNMTPVNLLATAYGLGSHHLDGLPDWANRTMYNVQAKADEATDAKLATLTKKQVTLEHQHMLQGLLADRFKLKTHWETRELPVYNLVVAKNGMKIKPGGSMPLSPEESNAMASGKLPEVHQRGNGMHGYELVGHSAHIAPLAQFLGFVMRTDVIDKTGLTATYDFDLQYSQASDERREADPTIWPPVTDAVQDQLGLTLEHAKAPVKMLVVDHIEPPSEN